MAGVIVGADGPAGERFLLMQPRCPRSTSSTQASVPHGFSCFDFEYASQRSPWIQLLPSCVRVAVQPRSIAARPGQGWCFSSQAFRWSRVRSR